MRESARPASCAGRAGADGLLAVCAGLLVGVFPLVGEDSGSVVLVEACVGRVAASVGGLAVLVEVGPPVMMAVLVGRLIAALPSRSKRLFSSRQPSSSVTTRAGASNSSPRAPRLRVAAG